MLQRGIGDCSSRVGSGPRHRKRSDGLCFRFKRLLAPAMAHGVAVLLATFMSIPIPLPQVNGINSVGSVGPGLVESFGRATSPQAAAAASIGGLDADVSAIGGFKESIPIHVPQFHAIRPEIAFSYDSARGNGEVGVGWQISVGSTIVRAGPRGGLPRYDASDSFMIDGAELVACAQHCQTGGTHETREQTFERIIFDGTTWNRWQRNGVHLVYETQEVPASAYEWSLAKVIDTHGNAVTYQQDCPSACVIDRITYASQTTGCGNPVQPTCKVGALIRFYHEARPDPVTYSTGRGARQIRQRLRTIEVRMDDQLVNAYQLQYDVSISTGNSVLRSMQEFGSDASISPSGGVTAGPNPPLPLISMRTSSTGASSPQWQEHATNWPYAITSPPGLKDFPAQTMSVPGNAYSFRPDGEDDLSPTPLLGDYDGDGRIDAASWRRSMVGGLCSPLYVRLASRPGGAPISTPPQGCPETGYVTDLNGDSADDLLLMNSQGSINQAVSKRDGTFLLKPGYTKAPWTGVKDRLCASGDLNGDDNGDLLCAFHKSGSLPELGIMRSTADGLFQVSIEPLPPTITSLQDVLLAVGDADASTTTDVFLAEGAPGKPLRLIAGYTAPDGSISSWETTQTSWGLGDPKSWRLSCGDVDGDARSDCVILHEAGGSTNVLVLLSVKGSAERFVPRASSIPAGNVNVADVDQDGRADLVSGDPVGAARSKGDGTFEAHQTWNTTVTCPVVDNAVAVTGDINGDGSSDLICSTIHGPAPRFQLDVQPAPVAPPPLHRWTTLDANGDGRDDLTAVHYRNPGYQIYTLLAQPAGGYVSSSTPILPDSAVSAAPLNNPDAAGWMIADVGGPEGRPDGKSDLVFVDRSGTTLRITTLLSTGAGWTVKYSEPWLLGGAPSPYNSADTQMWRLAELNGDARADLFHFVSLGAGVRFEYLLSDGAGGWISGSSSHFDSVTTAGGPLTRTDVNSFRMADLNRDKISDFVHVETGGQAGSTYMTVRSMLSTGAGQWEDETRQRFQAVDSAAAHRLQVIEFNGDGITDLGRSTVSGGCIRIEAYLRQGTDWSTPRSGQSAQPCQTPAGLEDRRNIILSDVNGDNRTDAYTISRVGNGTTARTALSTLVNPGDPDRPWNWTDQPNLSISEPDSWAWLVLDVDSDGKGELTHIGGVATSKLTTLAWTGNDDLLTEINNGRGAIKEIAYRAQPGERSYLPPGMLLTAVSHIAITESTSDPPVHAVASFSYKGALWSIPYQRLIGYASIRSDRGNRAMVTNRELTETCGARLSSTSLENASGGVINKSGLNYVDTGEAPPYTCLPATIVQSECEGTLACREKTTSYSYDSYGNTEMVEESGDAGRRRFYQPVRPNIADYLVDRPFKQEVLRADASPPPAGTWITQSLTLFGYDDDDWEHAPHERGDLTRITTFPSIANDVAADTFLHYDEVGNVVRIQDPVGTTGTKVYDSARSLFPVSICAATCSIFVWDEKLGVVRSVQDPNLQTTTTDYDAYRRPTKTTRADGSTTITRYLSVGSFTGLDSNRQRVRTETSDGSVTDAVHWHEELFDGLGRTYRTLNEGTTPVLDDVLVSDLRFTDASAYPASVILPHRAVEAPRETKYEYDGAMRLTALKYPDGSGVSRTYGVGRVENRDELEHLTTIHSDAFGRIVAVDEHARGCPQCQLESMTTRYTYDVLNGMLTVTDPAGNVTTIVRDDLGRETSITDPDRGTTTRAWRHDGSLDTEIDSNGVHSWTYDAAGRPISQVDTAGGTTKTVSWDYDADPVTLQAQGYSKGLPVLTQYSTAGLAGAVTGSERLWYDQLGRTIQARRCVDSVCQDMGATYDLAGRLSDLRYPDPGNPDGEHVKYTYDPAGRLASVGTYLTSVQSNASGQIAQQTYGNGLVEQRSYDPDRLWLDAQTLSTTPKSAAPVYAAVYQHDATARITNIVTANSSGPTPQPVTSTFTYDELGRLSTTTSSDEPSFVAQTFEYDAAGRMTRSPGTGAISYDDPAHLHAPTSSSAGHQRIYDRDGNLTKLSDPGGRNLKISWSPDGMPATISTGHGGTVFGYGARGERVKSTADGTATLFFDRFLEQGPKGLTKYYWAGDQLIARREANGAVFYVLEDHIHSTRVVTDQNRTVVGRYNYKPYGEQQAQNLTDNSPHLWQGQRHDADGGLVYMNARYYDAVMGVFTAPDSIVPDPYQPQSLNRYSFSLNDPVNRWDPSGHVSMRVEQKKEQERRGLSTVKMEAYAQQRQCINGFSGCSAALGGAIKVAKSGKKWVDESTFRPLSPEEKNIPSTFGLIFEGKGHFEDVIVPVSAEDTANTSTTSTTSTSAPTAAPTAPAVPTQPALNKSGPHRHPEYFFWVSREWDRNLGQKEKESKGLIHKGEGEVIGIVGANDEGPFVTFLGAAGYAISGIPRQKEIYGAIYGGKDVTFQWKVLPGRIKLQVIHDWIILAEGGYGAVVAGAYKTSHGTGVYFGTRVGHLAYGIGFNADQALNFLEALAGPLGPEEDNPWLSGWNSGPGP